MNEAYAWVMVAIIAAVTAVTRFLPFVVFRGCNGAPRIIDKLGRSLPYAIMGMLVIYCLKGISFVELGGFLPQIIASAAVIALYVWRRNTLLSIIVGTACYMLLVQLVF